MTLTNATSTAALKVAQGSRPGAKSRGNNEDSILVVRPRLNGDDRSLLCAIADGVGGMEQGEVASRAAVQALERALPNAPADDPGEALRKAVLAAHEAVKREAPAQDKTGRGGATTMVAALFRAGEIWIANAGDSRAYLLSPGRGIIQLTVDHSWVQEQVRAGLLDPEKAEGHPHRKVITRCLGGPVPPEVDLFHRRLAAGERVLLCSDGLPEVVRHSEIAQVLGSNDPDASVAAFMELAERRDAPDDMTVCVVHPNIHRAPGGAARDELTRSTGVSPGRPGGVSRARVFLWSTAPAALLVAGALFWGATGSTVVPGVSAAGVPLGGMTRQEAAEAVETGAAGLLECAQPLIVGGSQWVRTPGELGVIIDGRRTADQAWRIGHRGEALDQARERISVALAGATLSPALEVDQVALTRGMEEVGGQFNAANPGYGVDVPLAVGVASGHLVEQPCMPLTLPTVVIPAPTPGPGGAQAALESP